MSYSQIGQDVFVLNYYKNKSDGFFVDIGAGDGILFSNTFILEKNNWKGICIEPLPVQFDSLLKNRSATCINAVVYKPTDDNRVSFTINPDYVLSGITSHVPRSNNNVINVSLPTKTLTQILDENSAPKFIDYISIDTEGSEYIILQTIDFTKYKFGLIDVEHNYENEKRANIKHLLESNGYKHIKEIKWDDFYALNT